MRKKRLKLEVVVDEALKFLPRGMDVPCFTEWVKETIEQNKTLPRPPTRKDYEHYKKYLDDDCKPTIIRGFGETRIGKRQTQLFRKQDTR
jgi:hypothetical protein